jgi:type IV secretion system protein VirB10
MTDTPTVDDLADESDRRARSRRWTIYLVAGGCALFLAILAARWMMAGGHRENFARNPGIGAMGLPFHETATAAPKPPPSFSCPPGTMEQFVPVLHCVPIAPPPSPRPTVAAIDPGMLAPIGAVSAMADDPGGHGSRAGGAVDPPEGGAQDALSHALTPSDIGAPAKARRMAHPDYVIAAGTMFDCTSETAINSQLPGFFTCVLPAPVYGATGRIILLDKGTQIFGEIRSALQQGQNRVFVLAARARTPQNVVINLDSPFTDALGRSGIDGNVDNHFLQRFGPALLLSLVNYGPGLAGSALGGNGSNFNFIGPISPEQQIAGSALERQMNIPPTLESPEGKLVSIIVARDLDFSGAYGIQMVK